MCEELAVHWVSQWLGEDLLFYVYFILMSNSDVWNYWRVLGCSEALWRCILFYFYFIFNVQAKVRKELAVCWVAQQLGEDLLFDLYLFLF